MATSLLSASALLSGAWHNLLRVLYICGEMGKATGGTTSSLALSDEKHFSI